MTDEERISHNLSLMKSMNAPQSDIDQYLASENKFPNQEKPKETPISFLSTPSEKSFIDSLPTQQPLSDVDRIKHNINVMQQNGAPEHEIRNYLQSEYGYGSSLLRGSAQGATFNTSDEGIAAAKGLYDYLFGSGNFSKTYNKAVEEERSANELAEMANPKTYLAGEVAGGIAMPLGAEATAAKLALRAPKTIEAVGQGVSKLGFGASKEAAKKGMLERVKAGAKEGAAYGTLYGAGGAEGGLEKRAKGAASGAVGGALVGSALPPVVAGIAAPVKILAKPFTKPFATENETLTGLGEALIKDLGPSFAKTPEEAVNRLMARAKSLSKDPTAMLADIGGENTRRLMRQAQNIPNEYVDTFKRKLNQRQDSQHRRLEKSARKNLGQGKDFYTEENKLIKERAEKADPAFKNAYKEPWTPGSVEDANDLWEFLDRDYMNQLIEKTKNSIRGMKSKKAWEEMPVWEILHNVKQEINREVGRVKRSQQDTSNPKANWTLDNLITLNKEFKGLIRKYNPKLGKALDTYADESDMIEALRQGSDDVLKLSSDEMKRDLANYSKAEADLYRLGAQKQLIDKLIRKGQPQIDRTVRFADVDLQNKLKLLFPDQKSLRKFQRDLLIESKKNALKQGVQGGSRTDTNVTTGAELANPADAFRTMASAARGSIPDVALGAIDKAHKASNRMSKKAAKKYLEYGTMHPLEALPKLQKRIEKPSTQALITQKVTPGLSSLAAPYTGLYGGFGPKWEDKSSRE